MSGPVSRQTCSRDSGVGGRARMSRTGRVGHSAGAGARVRLHTTDRSGRAGGCGRRIGHLGRFPLRRTGATIGPRARLVRRRSMQPPSNSHCHPNVTMRGRLRNAKEPGQSEDIARRLQATGRRCLRPSPVRLTHRARPRASAARPAAFPSRSGAIRKSRRAADVLHRPSNRLLGLDRLFIRGVRPEPRSLDPRGRLGHRRTRTKYRFGAIAGGQPVSKVGPDAK